MPTDQQLKLALAKELPELIKVSPKFGYKDRPHFFWLDTGKEVTEREWDWVVNRVLQKINTIECWEQLGKEIKTGVCDTRKFGAIGDKTYTIYQGIITVTWQQRAIAYFRTIGKEIV